MLNTAQVPSKTQVTSPWDYIFPYSREQDRRKSREVFFLILRNAHSEKLPKDILILRERNYKVEKNVRGQVCSWFLKQDT